MFRIGQRLLCVADFDWQVTECSLTASCGDIINGPRYGEVVTFDGWDDEKYLYLVEHVGNPIDRSSYYSAYFRPLLDADLEEQVNELEEGVAANARLRESLFSKEKVINR